MKYDAKFHAFLTLAKFVETLLPKGQQLTKEQIALVHATSKKLAEDLTSGQYV